MTAPALAKPWDFTQVLNLINTLDAKHTTHPINPIPSRAAAHDFTTLGWNSLPNDSPLSPVESNAPGGVKLGDFSKVWELLGTPQDAPAPRLLDDTKSEKPTSPTLQQRVPAKTDYTSDGAIYLTPNKSSSKSIQWRDEAQGGDLIDVAPGSSATEADKLTKTQRKKKNRQERRRLAAEGQRGVSDFESETEETPARKASTHTINAPVELAAAQGKYNLRARDSFGKPTTTWTGAFPKTTVVQPVKSPQSFFEKRERSRSPTKTTKLAPSQTATVLPSTPVRHYSQPTTTTNKTPTTVGNENRKKDWPVSNPFQGKASMLLPSSVQPPRHADVTSAVKTPKWGGAVQPVHETPTKKGSHAIMPKTVRTGEDRDWALLLKLISDFYEDRGDLIKPANLANHSNHPKGIHVFVDASNIFIGFMDQLKRARNIPQYHHVPKVEPSFGALALLMERRRPVAKRVLVGSKPHLNAFDTAREIGYECNILDKVLKARELTERQIYFKEQERKMQAKKYGKQANRYRSGSDSGGDSTGPVYAPEAMVEQGVDEIIHLKMMESIVDTEEPSTMVLATGDAAQAEYSQGFMKMTQRALKAGWKVELVSWSKNISKAYTSTPFRKEWGDKFRIVELDDYAEELLDM